MPKDDTLYMLLLILKVIKKAVEQRMRKAVQ